MGSMSIWHWIIVGAVVLLLFGGKGKISDLMGDFAKGIKSFKKGMAEDDSVAESRPVETRGVDARTPEGIHQLGESTKVGESRKVG
jgi:sec-independent protein translocase protein TatA